MAEYSSLKVPELKKLLADKKLPQTGNKADLIARLQVDSAKAAKPTGTVAPTLAKVDQEDEIDYSDDDDIIAPLPSATTATALKPTAPKKADSETKPQAPAPAKPAPVKPSAPAQPATKAQPAAQDSVDESVVAKEQKAAAEPAQSFAMGLSKTAADAEAKKRADRAKRFGIDEDEDAKKRAERARRFGIDETELASGLDAALPEKSLKRGRARGGDEDVRAGKRQTVDRTGDRQGRNGRNRRASRQAGNRSPNKRGGVLDDPVERSKAEKRAARFAAA